MDGTWLSKWKDTSVKLKCEMLFNRANPIIIVNFAGWCKRQSTANRDNPCSETKHNEKKKSKKKHRTNRKQENRPHNIIAINALQCDIGAEGKKQAN